jgi:hypothetical protein
MSKRSRRYNTPEFKFVPDDIPLYDSITTLQHLCSADDILDRFKYDNPIIFKNIRVGKTDLKEILPMDEKCLCDMGWGKRPYVNRYYCISCELMRRLSDSVKVPESKIIKIEVGKHKGKIIRITEHEDIYDGYSEDSEVNYLFTRLLKSEYKLNLLDLTTLKLSEKNKIINTPSYTTNYIMTCVFLTHKLQKYKLPNIPLFDWSFYCNGKVKILEPEELTFSNLLEIESFQKTNKVATAHTTLNPLTLPIVISITKQLTYLLHLFKRYLFIHGNPSISSVRFSIKNTSIKYGSLVFDSPVIMHIQPSSSSSFTLETDDKELLRFINRKNSNELSNKKYPITQTDVIINYEKTPFEETLDIPMIKEIDERLIYCYKIGPENMSEFLDITVNLGVPLVHSSFEFYCFLISLMCEDSFYSTFMSNDNLRAIWYNIWRESEYEDMMKQLQKLKLQITVENSDVYILLSAFTLRADVIDFFFEKITKI